MMRLALLVLALASASSAAAQEISWPRDRGSGQPVVVQPIPHPAMVALVTVHDYPPSQVRANVEGDVSVRLTVSATGKVSDCAVHQTSGSEVLDHAACILMKRRARFEPALDAAGKPTESQVDHVVVWKITDQMRSRR